MQGEQLFLEQIELVDRIIRFVARRHGLSFAEAEEFQSIVRLRLIEDDYRILRQFRQRSSLSTYLVTIIQRLLLDHRVSLWGKWRPSAEARRAGPVGIRLELLMGRDGLSFDEASEILITNEGVGLSRAALRAIGERLPARAVRRFVSEELLAECADPRMDVEADVLRGEQTKARSRLSEDLAQAIQALPAEDRLIIQMRFEQGLTVAQVAALLHQPAKALYRRVERLLAGLRRTLEARGYTANEAVQAIDDADSVSSTGEGPENRPREPSFIGRSRT